MSETERPEESDGELAKVAREVFTRMQRGEPANKTPLVQLTPEKRRRPSLLCLDMRLWVELGRAHYGKNPVWDGALRKLQQAVAQGIVVAPIDSANAFEAAGAASAERRSRLCSFMLDLSRNHALLPVQAIRPMELANAIATLYGDVTPATVRDRILRRGMGACHNVFPGQGRLSVVPPDLYECFTAPEMSMYALMHLERASRDEQVQMGIEGAVQLAGIRELDSHMSLETRRTAECQNIDGGSVALELDAELDRAGIDRTSFRSWLREGNAERFWTAVPAQDVSLTLMLIRDRNSQDATKPNDLLDWEFLQKAIPYADAVGTELRWADYARRGGLDRKYGTALIPSCGELESWLDAVAKSDV